MAAEDEFATEVITLPVGGRPVRFSSGVVSTWVGGQPVGFAGEVATWDSGVAP